MVVFVLAYIVLAVMFIRAGFSHCKHSYIPLSDVCTGSHTRGKYICIKCHKIIDINNN